MPSHRASAIVSRLGFTTALLMFGLIVIGSVVRGTGSGLACPDWPLCHGRLLPPLQFNVLVEWFHRLVALLVSLLLFATVGTVMLDRETRAHLGGLALLTAGLLCVQVLLGALTVWKLLSPAVVSTHLAAALLLFSALLTLALAASGDAGEAGTPPAERPAGLLPLCGTVAAMVYAQAVLGGTVSSSGAALACAEWPTCNGEWFPPLSGPVGLQMMHRYGGYAVVLGTVAVALAARRAPDAGVRAGARLVLGLTASQVVLGVCTVFLGAPAWLSAMHLANAAAILALMVIVTFRVARLPAPRTRLVPAEAR